jgi:TusA-related sulfurtransferase
VPAIRKIDIRNVDWPVCILNCKNELNQMKSGETMEVIVQDTDVVNNLITLIEQLPDLQIEKYKDNKYHKLIIKKDQLRF